ncbi:GDSL esterase/lipase, partial [Mucuna pruriens]
QFGFYGQALQDIGGRNYALAGLGLLGCTPGVVYSYGTNESCVEEVNAAAFIYNDKLKALVDEFNHRFSATSKFIFINTAATALHISNTHGFLVSNAACCSTGSSGECIPDRRPCHNRNDYVFWDAFHTTQAWNLLNAIIAYNSTINPSFTYPMDIKHLVDKMELEFTNESTSQLNTKPITVVLCSCSSFPGFITQPLLPHQFHCLDMACECETKTLLVVLLFLSTTYMQNCVHGVSQVPCLFIFGDSLSDSGNNNELPTSAKSNYRPYGIDFPTGPTGRFTNGRTEIDIINYSTIAAQLLGFENFIPPFANTSGSDILKGVNYASGGAGIRVETGTHMGVIISLGLQLRNHRVIVSKIATRLGSPDIAREYLEKCLYYVNIGSNDYIGNYFRPQFYSTSSIYSPEQYAQALIEELSLNLLALHEIGARKYVLVGLGLLGCTPSVMHSHGTNGSCVEEENAAAFNFNNKLKALVDQFNNRFSANSKFIFTHTASKALDKSNGFLVSDAACCPSGCIPDQKPCYNRSDYVFWDEVHPTEAWNLLNAKAAYNSTISPAFTYPMDIKHLVNYEIKRELEFTNVSTSQLSATE